MKKIVAIYLLIYLSLIFCEYPSTRNRCEFLHMWKLPQRSIAVAAVLFHTRIKRRRRIKTKLSRSEILEVRGHASPTTIMTPTTRCATPRARGHEGFKSSRFYTILIEYHARPCSSEKWIVINVLSEPTSTFRVKQPIFGKYVLPSDVSPTHLNT